MAVGDLVRTHVRDALELRTLYQEFWRVFRASLNGLVVKPESLLVNLNAEKQGESVRIDFGEAPLRILGVKGLTGGGAAADIYFSSEHIAFRVEGQNGPVWKLLRSEIRLLYLNALENKVARQAWSDSITQCSFAYAGYQFLSDAGPSPRPHFPDCHAAYKLDPFKEITIERLYLKTTRDEIWRGRYLANQPFFPTAPMDITALVYGFLHCHRQMIVATGWPQDFRASLDKLPTFSLKLAERSTHQSWWDHHRPPQPAPPVASVPPGFRLSAEARNAGWSVTIRGHERLEEPHVTITRGDGSGGNTWRYGLRERALLEGSEMDVRADVMEEVKSHREGWVTIWNERDRLENGRANQVGG